MIEIGILHATLPAYMKQAPDEEAKHLNVVCADNRLAAFIAQARIRRPRVLVVDLLLLGDDPAGALAALEREVQPELVLVVYAFARWESLEALRGPGRQIMRAPLSVRMMRASLVSLIVRSLTNVAPPPAEGALPTTPPAARRFDDLQLAALQEMRSAVKCECPNQVADLVLSLGAFEQYSQACANRNAEDAKVHAMLARVTGHARALMELALADLCAFERIDVARLARLTGSLSRAAAR